MSKRRQFFYNLYVLALDFAMKPYAKSILIVILFNFYSRKLRSRNNCTQKLNLYEF